MNNTDVFPLVIGHFVSKNHPATPPISQFSYPNGPHRRGHSSEDLIPHPHPTSIIRAAPTAALRSE